MKASYAIWSLCSPEYFLAAKDSRMGSCLRTAHRPLGYRRCQEERAASLYHGRSVTHRDHYLMCLCEFFQSRLTASHPRAVNSCPSLETLLPVLLVPLAFSPCPDANGGIGLLAIGSSKCSSLRLPWVNDT